ncbi:hypothetical protein OG21DRAFT_1484260 [Imleria badia]|nr:hypothetical protein OG21DRAFT_1484260 [Imleria badia]
MNSFLDMEDDDEDEDEDEDDSTMHARVKPDQDGRPKVKAHPPYDTSSPSNVNFSSEIIGTTMRPGGFLSVPGELDDCSSESSGSYHNSDFEVDYPSSPYDGIATPDSEVDFPCSPYDGIATTDSEVEFCSPYDGIATIDSEVDFPCSPDEGIATTNSKSDFSCSPYDGIATIDSGFEFSCLPYDEPTISNVNICVHDSRDGSAAPHEGLDLMRRLLAELRDPNLDCKPRPLSEDSDSEYSADDDEEEASVPRLTSMSVLHHARRNSLESTSTPGIDSDVSDEGPIYPLTPHSKPSPALARAPDVHLDRMSPPGVPMFNEEVLVTSPRSWDSPPPFPTKAYVRSHRDNRQYGLPAPLLSLPRL